MDRFDFLKRRYLEYWSRENHDRPLMRITTGNGKQLPELKAPPTLKQRWEDPDYVIKNARRWIESTHFHAEAVPAFSPNLGPDIVGAVAGCGIEYGEDTSWAKHCVADWNDYPDLVFDENNPYLKKIEALTAAAVADARGEYLVGITDLHPGMDGLVSLRGPENLCYDLIDAPEQVKTRSDQLFYIHKQMMLREEKIIAKNQTGSINWMGVWHPEKRWYVTGCDFCCMVSKPDFEEFVAPGLVQELSILDASIFHLDGPDALRHLDRLLEFEKINGIQWVYGAGQPGARHWLDVLKKIQAANKMIHIECAAADVQILCENLQPEGLYLNVPDSLSPDEAESLIKLAEKASRG